MAQRALYTYLDEATVSANLKRAREQIDDACRRSGRAAGNVEILVATKYISSPAMESLSRAGVKLVGENRAQDLVSKYGSWGNLFEWDFIGHLQSNKVRQVLPLVRLIHAIDSVPLVEEIDRRASGRADVLLQVNIGQESSKYGIIPSEVDRFLEEASKFSKVNFTGLMTMPPLAANPESVRPIFAALRETASLLSSKWRGRYNFSTLSMGTSADFVIAVEEGATIVRLGGTLFQAENTQGML
jgi:hypothetical protein